MKIIKLQKKYSTFSTIYLYIYLFTFGKLDISIPQETYPRNCYI